MAAEKEPIYYQQALEFHYPGIAEINWKEDQKPISKIILESPFYPDDETLSLFANVVYDTKKIENLEKSIHDIVENMVLQEIDRIKFANKKLYENRNDIAKKKLDEFLTKIANQKLHENKTNIANKKLHENWTVLAWAKCKKDKYFGAAFWNNEHRQLVISHRGTVKKWNDRKTLLTDVKGIMRLEFTSQISSACTFSAVILRIFEDNESDPISISFTGHSLGAWLAQITAFSTKYLQLSLAKRKNSDAASHARFMEKDLEIQDFYSHAHTVVFDSPGCYEMLCQISNYYYEKYKKEAYPFVVALDITIYFNTPNLVNSINSHQGISKRVQIFEAENNKSFVDTLPDEISFFSLESHNMINFVRMLTKSENVKILRISNWPSFSLHKSVNKIVTNENLSIRRSAKEIVKVIFNALDNFQSPENELRVFYENKEIYNVEMNDNGHIIVHYNTTEMDLNSGSVSVFTEKELKFLKNWVWFKREKNVSGNFAPFLNANELGDFEKFLPNFSFGTGKNRKMFSCLDSNTLVSRVKFLTSFLPDALENLDTDVKNILIAYEELYRTYSEKYVATLPSWNICFQDTLNLETFLNSEDRLLVFAITDQNSKEQVFKIRSILNVITNFQPCYLSLDNLNELAERGLDVEQIFKDADCHVDYILVIDCDGADNYDLLYKIISAANNADPKFPKKLIIVIKGDNEDIQKEPIHMRQLLYNDLTEDTQDCLLKKNVFYLGERELSLNDFVKVNSSKNLTTDIKDYLSLPNVLYPLIDNTKQVQLNSENITHYDDLKVSTCRINQNVDINQISQLLTKNKVELEKHFGKSVLFFITGKQNLIAAVEDLIIVNKESAENNFVTFYELCRDNMHRRIYWLNFSENLLELKQIFDKDFYINRRLYHKMMIKPDKIKDIVNNKKISGTIVFCSRYSLPEFFNSDNVDFVGSVEELRGHMDPMYLPGTSRQEPRTLNQIFQQSSLLNSLPKKSFIVARNMEIALEVLKKAQRKPVHLIDIGESGKFIWIRSEGSLEDLYDNVEVNESTSTDIKCLTETTDTTLEHRDTKATLLADESGMGKSTLMLKLAKNFPNSWVIWVNLIHFRKNNDHLLLEINLDAIIKFLEVSNKHLSGPLVKEMLRYSLLNANSLPVVIFFDGFDEIRNEVARNKLVELFQYLKMRTTAKILISTRLWARKILENGLSTFAIRIKEIEEEEQMDFIRKLWSPYLCLEKGMRDLKEQLNHQVKELFLRKDFFIINHFISSHDRNQLEFQWKTGMETKVISSRDLKSFAEKQELIFEKIKTCAKNRSNLEFEIRKQGITHPQLLDLVSFAWSLNRSENRFCQKYLKKNYLLEETTREKAEIFIKILLLSFAEIKEDCEDSLDVDILGIPLQLRMLGEILQPQFNEDRELKFPEKISTLRELFKRFSTSKFIYTTEKLGKQSSKKILLTKEHKCLAFQLLFPDLAKEILKNEEIFDINDEMWKLIVVSLNQIGIVEVFESGEFRFIHSSVAEYFAAEKILELLKMEPCPPSLRRLMATDILLKDEYKMIRRFLNDYLDSEPTAENLFRFDEELNTNSKGETCLHVCVSENLVKLVSMILTSFELKSTQLKLIDAKNNDGETAIQYSAFNNQLELATILLSYNPKENILHFKADELNDFKILWPEENLNPESTVSVSFSKHTLALFYVRNNAIFNARRYRSNHTESHKILELIAKYGKVEDLSVASINTLTFFAMTINAHEEINEIQVKYAPILKIEEMFVENIMHQTESGDLLHLAIVTDDFYLVIQMLNQNVNVINHRDKTTGATPILTAASYCRWKIVDELLNRKADPNIVDNKNRSVAYYAAAFNRYDLLLKLFRRKVNLNFVENENFVTPLGIAASQGHWDVAETLIRHGADVNIPLGNYNTTVLHYAAGAGKREIVIKLLEKGALADESETSDHLTPLIMAAKGQYWDIVRVLLKHNVNVNKQTSAKVTALIVATFHGNLDIVLKLLNKGADINASPTPSSTPLFIAAQRKHWNLVSALIDRGANVNTLAADSGMTIIHYAAVHGQYFIVQKLLDKGANLNITENISGTTLVYLAALQKRWDIVLELIKKGADINIKNRDSVTVLHIAAANGEIEVVEELLKHNALINATTNDKITPMTSAAASLNWDIVIKLIEKGADVNIALSKHNQTVLYCACFHNQLDVVKKLIEKDANINAIHTEENCTPIFTSAIMENWDIVSFLIDNKANFYIPNKNFTTVLHVATSHGNLAIVEKLIKTDPRSKEMLDFINATDIKGNTALGISASEGHWEIAKELIENEANFEAKLGSSKVTIFHYAASEGKTDIIKLLLDRGANIESVEEVHCYTPLTIAAKNRRWETVELLINRGADVNSSALSQKDNPGRGRFTALHFAAYHNALEIVNKLLMQERMKKGADEEIYAQTAALIAASMNHWDVVLALTTNGANIRKPNTNSDTNMTVLHYAAKEGQVEVVRKLLERNDEIDINAKESRTGMTPVFLAALNDHWDVVTDLINNEAKINIRDEKNTTVLHLAAKRGKLELVEKLIQKNVISGIIDEVEATENLTPICMAALNNHWDIVLKLIEQNSNVNHPCDTNDTSILHLAAGSGKLDVVKALLDHKAELDATEKSKNVTPIYAAALKEHWDVVLELIRRGAKMDIATKNGEEKAIDLIENSDREDVVLAAINVMFPEQ